MTTATKKRKKKTIGIQFTPQLNDPLFPKGHVLRRMRRDSRVASPWLEDYLEALWPEGYKRKDKKGNDGRIGNLRTEVRCLKKDVYWGLNRDRGSGRECTYEKLIESMTYRDCFLITDIKDEIWITVKIPVSIALKWIEDGWVSDKGMMLYDDFWVALESDLNVTYNTIYLG